MIDERTPLSFLNDGRLSLERVGEQAELFRQQALLCEVLDSMPDGVVVINGHRQIVYANEQFLVLVARTKQEGVLGQRPGEALSCVNASKGEDGCGSSEFCRLCGAGGSIAAAEQGTRAVRECRLIRSLQGQTEYLDLRIWSTPFHFRAEQYVLFVVSNIADEKRREILERLFLDDVSEDVSAIHLLADLAAKTDPGVNERLDQLQRVSARLKDEIDEHKMLRDAEQGELFLEPSTMGSLEILVSAAGKWKFSPIPVCVDPKAADLPFQSDRRLVLRILESMIENAVEACGDNERVALGCDELRGRVCFRVHNPAFMHRSVQLQVFQRSFSTKGGRRGLGTYAMKLYAEQYLGADVFFDSDQLHGTTFKLAVPLTWPTQIER